MRRRDDKILIEEISSERFTTLLRAIGCESEGPADISDKAGKADALAILHALDGAQRKQLDETIPRIGEMGDEDGINAILIAADENAAIGEAIQSHKGPVDSALWVYLEHNEIFQNAEAVLFAEARRWRNEKWVGRYRACATPDFAYAGIDRSRLKNAAATAFAAAKMKGDPLDMELLERPNSIEEGALRIVQAVFSHQGRPTAERNWHESERVFERRIPSHEAAVLYEPDAGEIYVIAEKGGNKLKNELAAAWCQAVLDDPPPARVPLIALNLDLLRKKRPLEPKPEDGITNVRVTHLGMPLFNGGFMTFSADNGENIWNTMEKIGASSALGYAQDIYRAYIEISFSDTKAAGGTIIKTLKLTKPHNISARGFSHNQYAIARRRLVDWGLVDG